MFENDVYFLNTDLKLIKLELKLNGRQNYQESIVPIESKIEDFFCEKVNGGCKITYITDQGLIKEYGSGADPNKSLDCTKHTQNVNYWNKVVKVGNCVLAAGMVDSSQPQSNSLGLMDKQSACRLSLKATRSLLSLQHGQEEISPSASAPSCECLRSLVKSIRT